MLVIVNKRVIANFHSWSNCPINPGAPLLLKWIHFNLSIGKNLIYMPGKVWYEINNPLPNFNGCTVEVWECISNSIPHFMMDVIAYPCWD